ncbi:hypothetical protein ALI22I_24465 [Saccharothrix sp. ALI-22-I]|uniref:ClpP family protease n=1 Tax=Saccharothrix sp. ALI-22-I TaxID=1933778 RepID=UPI0009C86AC0|nr:ATP-dependent Clp protease proteolytic subunit [Saccharothrix sp. ALI-22-I]ONI86763.1 hypothetical protein ALI22I_24465 [Saccharothrix sp. ALI-22-I]
MAIPAEVAQRLMRERTIVLGSEIDDAQGNRIVAQLLLMEQADPTADIHFYINSPGGFVTASSGETPPSTSPSQATTTAPGAVTSFADLERQPCQALGRENTVELGVVIDPTETDLNGESCQWFTAKGLIAFTPYASIDHTTAAEYQHLTPSQIGGHKALTGTVTHGRDVGRTMYVSVGTDQSFRIIVSPGRGATAADVCGLATEFATAIVAVLP